jgi:hypothetical protein
VVEWIINQPPPAVLRRWVRPRILLKLQLWGRTGLALMLRGSGRTWAHHTIADGSCAIEETRLCSIIAELAGTIKELVRPQRAAPLLVCEYTLSARTSTPLVVLWPLLASSQSDELRLATSFSNVVLTSSRGSPRRESCQQAEGRVCPPQHFR